MVAIIDYGVGNLFSLQSSFAAIGEEATGYDSYCGPGDPSRRRSV